MRIGSIVVVIWLVIGVLAAFQRGYLGDTDVSCNTVSTTVVTVLAGPLNYVGVNPQVSCPDVSVPEPSS